MHETLYSCFLHFVICRPYSVFKMGRWSYWLFTSLWIYVFDMDCYLSPSLRYAEFMSLAFVLEYVYVCVNITCACLLFWTWCPLGKTQLTDCMSLTRECSSSEEELLQPTWKLRSEKCMLTVLHGCNFESGYYTTSHSNSSQFPKD